MADPQGAAGANGPGAGSGAAPGGAAPAGTPSGGGAPPAGVPAPGSGSGAGAGGGAGAGAAAGSPFDWKTTLGDRFEEFRPAIEAKGFKTAAEALQSYTHLEKLLGADKAGRTVILPGENATPEELAAFHGKLGRPEKPEGYQLEPPKDAPEGMYSTEFANDFRAVAHAAGVPQGQAKALHDWWVGKVVAQVKAEAEATAAAEQRIQVELDKEWGAAKPRKVELAKRAAKELFGDDAGAMTKLEQALTTPSFLKRMAAIGEKLGGDTLGEPGKASLAMTPERAQAEITRKLGDPQFSARYYNRQHPDHASAVAEMNALHQAAAPEPKP